MPIPRIRYADAGHDNDLILESFQVRLQCWTWFWSCRRGLSPGQVLGMPKITTTQVKERARERERESERERDEGGSERESESETVIQGHVAAERPVSV